MSNFEKRFGKYAIRNISLVLILCYVLGYFIGAVNETFLEFLTLDPWKILHGQIWRVFTWVIIPPASLGLFTIIMLMFYYNIGTALENTWGTYRFNVYLLSGLLFTVAGSFVWLAVVYFAGGNAQDLEDASFYASHYFSTYYVNLSIFLAFAACYPNIQVLLMFIIPIKVKWMGILDGVLLAYEFYVGNTVTKIVILSSLLNFIIFLVTSRSHIHMTPRQMKRRMEFKQDIRRNSKVTKHKCAVCGQTEDDNPELEFRFCSKCNGNYEYCQQHLFTHTHVR